MLLLAHSTFVGDKLSDFPGGTGYSHRAPVIKAMWPGATIIWTVWIKQLRKWHILTILTIIWYTNQIKPHIFWGKSIVTDVSCLAIHVQSIWSAFSIEWAETFWQIKISWWNPNCICLVSAFTHTSTEPSC